METPSTLYSVRDVARLFGLQESRIRYWAQTGFINPSASAGGKRLYTFVDLLGIKAAKELLDRGIPLQRVRKNLQALREAGPELDRPLAQLCIRCDGEHLVVAHRDGAFEPITGQLILDFEVDELRTSLPRLLELKPEPQASAEERAPGKILSSEAAAGERSPVEKESPPTTAYGWFLHGCSLEPLEGQEDQAIEAYQRALDLDPGLASAHTNIGNIHYRRGDRARALHHYQTACALDPDQAEAHFNLANMFEEVDDLEMSIAEHRRALAADPEFLDAHFNLALVLEQVGSKVQALTHWKRFLEITGPASSDSWSAVARRRIDELEASG